MRGGATEWSQASRFVASAKHYGKADRACGKAAIGINNHVGGQSTIWLESVSWPQQRPGDLLFDHPCDFVAA